MLVPNQHIPAAKDGTEQSNFYFSEGRDNYGLEERGIFTSDVPVTLQQELRLHFSHAATGGQPEGGSRPQTSPKNGAGGSWGGTAIGVLGPSSRVGCGVQTQRGVGSREQL